MSARLVWLLLPLLAACDPEDCAVSEGTGLFEIYS